MAFFEGENICVSHDQVLERNPLHGQSRSLSTGLAMWVGYCDLPSGNTHKTYLGYECLIVRGSLGSPPYTAVLTVLNQ